MVAFTYSLGFDDGVANEAEVLSRIAAYTTLVKMVVVCGPCVPAHPNTNNRWSQVYIMDISFAITITSLAVAVLILVLSYPVL
jgi:hypothetical protein